jgi:hypothetical protein
MRSAWPLEARPATSGARAARSAFVRQMLAQKACDGKIRRGSARGGAIRQVPARASRFRRALVPANGGNATAVAARE